MPGLPFFSRNADPLRRLEKYELQPGEMELPEAGKVITTFPAMVDEEVTLRGLTGRMHMHRIAF